MPPNNTMIEKEKLLPSRDIWAILAQTVILILSSFSAISKNLLSILPVYPTTELTF